MLPDRVSNPGPLTYEPGALPIALRGPAYFHTYTQLSPHIWLDSRNLKISLSEPFTFPVKHVRVPIKAQVC